jgi:cell division protein FtsW
LQTPQPALAEQATPVAVEERQIDLWLLGAVLCLLVIGTVEVFSSSAVYALRTRGDSWFFLERHILWLGLGLLAMWVGVRADYRWLRRWTYPLLFLSLALLGLVLAVGIELNGARRWLGFGPLSFQPVELAKLALITYLAYSLGKKANKVKTFTVGFVPHLVVCFAMMALLMKQPDLGSSIILGATTLTLLFVAGAKASYILFALLAAAPVVYYKIIGTPWRLQRFLAYLNPEAFADGAAYQVIQARIAVGSGGATGLGLGEGRQALGYMPEGHNDFIMASIGEELGFVGIAAVLLLFVVVVWRGLRAALGARDVFGCYLALGITVSFGLQAIIHAGVVLGLLPAKGLTLPLVSYGGSSLVMSLFFVGVLLDVGRRAAPRARRRVLASAPLARRRKRRAVFVVGSLQGSRDRHGKPARAAEADKP